MFVKAFVSIIFILCISTIAWSQYRVHFKNSVYPEVGGNGIHYSLNYERVLKSVYIVRVGIGGADRTLSAPMLIGALIGNGKHHLQALGGVSFIKNNVSVDTFGQAVPPTEWKGTASLGYRYQQRGDRLVFSIAYTPFFGREFSAGAGIACGYRFN